MRCAVVAVAAMATGAFPGGLHGSEARPSVFNTGQILQGLVRAHMETKRPEILQAVVAAGDWLIGVQQPDDRGPDRARTKTRLTLTTAWSPGRCRIVRAR